MIANYGEAREFKNICDGFKDHVKTPLKSAITRLDLILDSPRAVFEYLDSNMSFGPGEDNGKVLHRRSFHFVEKQTIRVVSKGSGRSVPGLLGIHSVIGLKTGFIATRKLSCFCEKCISKWDTKDCINKDYVKDWNITHI